MLDFCLVWFYDFVMVLIVGSFACIMVFAVSLAIWDVCDTLLIVDRYVGCGYWCTDSALCLLDSLYFD